MGHEADSMRIVTAVLVLGRPNVLEAETVVEHLTDIASLNMPTLRHTAACDRIGNVLDSFTAAMNLKRERRIARGC